MQWRGRNPKSETRNPEEIQSPNSENAIRRNVALWSADIPQSLRPPAPAELPLRVSNPALRAAADSPTVRRVLKSEISNLKFA